MSVTAKALIQAQFASGLISILYTAPLNTRTIIDQFTATNIDSSSHTLSVYLVPALAAAGSSNEVIQAQSLTSGLSMSFSTLKNQILNPGDAIAVIADAPTFVVVRASGRECV
jgi:hypothetical protein